MPSSSERKPLCFKAGGSLDGIGAVLRPASQGGFREGRPGVARAERSGFFEAVRHETDAAGEGETCHDDQLNTAEQGACGARSQYSSRSSNKPSPVTYARAFVIIISS